MKPEIESVTSQEYREAKYGVGKIEAVVNALAALDERTVPNEEARASITVFEAKIRLIYNRYKSYIKMGDKQHLERDQKFITNVSRRAIDVQNDIELLESNFRHRLKAEEHKVAALKRDGLSEQEIAELVDFITESDHKELAEKVQILKDERVAAKAFLADAPAYDIEILKGTSLYPDNSELVA